MLILLPPSEGKSAPHTGAPLDLDDLVFPELAGERRTMLGVLATASTQPNALSLLGVGKTLEGEVTANTTLDTRPAAPGYRVYTGVLFDALGYAGMPAPARRRAREDVLVFSALFGVTALRDRIPAYRLPISARLPGFGGLASWWRPRLSPELDERAERTGLIIDCRSGGYASQWQAPADKTLTVDVYQLRSGQRAVVTHFAKLTRGLVSRILLETGSRRVRTPDDAAQVVAQAGSTGGPHRWQVDLVQPSAGQPGRLEVTLPED